MDGFGGLATGLGVGGENVVDGVEFGARGTLEDAFDDFRDAGEGETILEKGGDGDFVGGVECGGMRATFLHGFAGQAEAGEAAGGGFFEIKAAESGPVELDVLRRDASGIGERVLNGHTHVGRSELRKDSAINELDEGVNHGLRVDDDLDLIGAHVEQPAGFDNFEALVHHGGGIDGDAVAHFPVGVGEGLIDGDVGELVDGRFAEWAAGGGEDDSAHFRVERGVR